MKIITYPPHDFVEVYGGQGTPVVIHTSNRPIEYSNCTLFQINFNILTREQAITLANELLRLAGQREPEPEHLKKK